MSRKVQLKYLRISFLAIFSIWNRSEQGKKSKTKNGWYMSKALHYSRGRVRNGCKLMKVWALMYVLRLRRCIDRGGEQKLPKREEFQRTIYNQCSEEGEYCNYRSLLYDRHITKCQKRTKIHKQSGNKMKSDAKVLYKLFTRRKISYRMKEIIL